MNTEGKRFRILIPVATVILAFFATSCAHVHQDEMETELDRIRAELRGEIEDGDEAVERRVGQRMDGIDARMDEFESQLRALEDDFQVTVERLEDAIRFNTPVHFAFDDATLREEDRPVLDRFADVVREYYPTALVTVEGFTDPAGSAQYNLQLGERRAEAVKEHLESRGGLPSQRLRTVSYGQDPDRQVRPGAQGPGEVGWENRRVALVIDFGEMERADPPVAEGDGAALSTEPGQESEEPGAEGEDADGEGEDSRS